MKIRPTEGTMEMKRFFAVLLTAVMLLTLTACDDESADTGNVISLSFSDRSQIKLSVGESHSMIYLRAEVKSLSDFSPDSIEFISQDTEVASIGFDRVALGTYLYFTVTGIGPGETFVYAKVKGSDLISEKIKVTVYSDCEDTASDTDRDTETASPSETKETDPLPSETSREEGAPETERETDEPSNTKPSESETPSAPSIELISLTSPVGRNESAKLMIKGLPDTEYSISVYYSTTASTASGLEAKISDPSGSVTWEWKVGGKTKPGEHRIVIKGGGETLTVYFVTTE